VGRRGGVRREFLLPPRRLQTKAEVPFSPGLLGTYVATLFY
jgi:hypothetical protein